MDVLLCLKRRSCQKKEGVPRTVRTTQVRTPFCSGPILGIKGLTVKHHSRAGNSCLPFSQTVSPSGGFPFPFVYPAKGSDRSRRDSLDSHLLRLKIPAGPSLLCFVISLRKCSVVVAKNIFFWWIQARNGSAVEPKPVENNLKGTIKCHHCFILNAVNVWLQIVFLNACFRICVERAQTNL